MPRWHYTDDFRDEAVALYESTPGATLSGIALDLGISRETLAKWVTDRGKRGRPGPGRGSPGGQDRPVEDLAVGSPEEQVERLRARVAELEARQELLESERDILRKAAKYFAGETTW